MALKDLESVALEISSAAGTIHESALVAFWMAGKDGCGYSVEYQLERALAAIDRLNAAVPALREQMAAQEGSGVMTYVIERGAGDALVLSRRVRNTAGGENLVHIATVFGRNMNAGSLLLEWMRPATDITYRNYRIHWDPPPIPDRRYDWHFAHEDWDLGDRRLGEGPSLMACLAEIDEQIEEDQ